MGFRCERVDAGTSRVVWGLPALESTPNLPKQTLQFSQSLRWSVCTLQCVGNKSE